MPRVFALADLHLSLTGDKPMHVFSEIWRDHPARMARAWDARVRPEDVVLLPGDLSWAKTLPGAQLDLAWIGARPGRKLLLRGNHDSWWSSLSKVRRALPDGCEALQNDAMGSADCVIVGTRGWTEPDDPIATPRDGVIFRRELERLELSVRDADARFGRELPRIAMLHFPPWIEGRDPSPMVAVLERAAVTHCVYGHLHGEDHRLGLTGERRGIHYHLVAADAVDFRPVEIPLGPRARGG